MHPRSAHLGHWRRISHAVRCGRHTTGRLSPASRLPQRQRVRTRRSISVMADTSALTRRVTVRRHTQHTPSACTVSACTVLGVTAHTRRRSVLAGHRLRIPAVRCVHQTVLVLRDQLRKHPRRLVRTLPHLGHLNILPCTASSISTAHDLLGSPPHHHVFLFPCPHISLVMSGVQWGSSAPTVRLPGRATCSSGGFIHAVHRRTASLDLLLHRDAAWRRGCTPLRFVALVENSSSAHLRSEVRRRERHA